MSEILSFNVSFNGECEHINATANVNQICEKIADNKYYAKNREACFTLDKEEYSDTTACRQRVIVENVGDKAFVLDSVSPVFVQNLGNDGKRDWFDDRFVIHYAHSAWQGEAQWRHESISEAGLYKTYNHQTKTSIILKSFGTWSTAKYEPVIMIEDKETQKTWYFEIQCGTGWMIEVRSQGGPGDGSVSVALSGACEQNDGWFKVLNPGETYTSCYASYGCVDGGFEEAVGELTKMRRHIMKNEFPEKQIPLCFNDYMNCLWALPTKEKLIPLIDMAAKVGAEYFVIDAGWFKTDGNFNLDMGDWAVDNELFGEGGMQWILDYIVSKGMKPGTWLEIESIGIGSEFAKEPSVLLTRHGMNIGEPKCFLNFRNEKVRQHLMGVFDMLYGMGIRFIKNDYNSNTGIGVDGVPGQSLADALQENQACFMSFIDEVISKYPDLIIENCGSGAMRSDMQTLSHFYLQSSSDQEDYRKVPSIVSGICACLPPERCGIWPYPYAVPIYQRECFDYSNEFVSKFADGRETVFNMVSGLMGLMYLSGRIGRADEYNLKLMQEAAEIYKRNRKLVENALPIYPSGTFDMADSGIFSFGFIDREKRKMVLAVWCISGDYKGAEETLESIIDLSKYSALPVLTNVYPNDKSYTVKLEETKLKVNFEALNSAVYLEFEI